MNIPFLNNIKSGFIKDEIKKSLVKLEPKLIVPAVDNILESISLVDKDKKEIKAEIQNKLAQLIQALK